MNLIISIPAGILAIIAIYAFALKLFKVPTSTLGGILAILVTMIYGSIAILDWPGGDVFAIHIALYLLSVYGMWIVTSQKRTKSKLHWAPVSIFVFFGVIIVTDSVLILLAENGMSSAWVKRILPEPSSSGNVQSIFPGTVSHDFREKTDQFNIYQQKRRHQKELGWSIKLGWKNEAQAGVHNALYVEIKDAQGHVLDNANVTARFMYPADMNLDQTLKLSRAENGLYVADLTLMNPGDWSMILNIKHGQDQYEMRTRTTIHQAR
jgi:nitrogen fixation protein FixH